MPSSRDRITSPKRRQSEVPVESFADIAFLLIIFFILTTTLVPTLGLETEMPSSAKAEQEEEEADTPSVAIRDGEIFYSPGKDEPTAMSLPELRSALRKLNLPQEDEEEDKIVLLETSGGVDYQTYYRVLVAIGEAGGVVGMVREAEGEE